MINKKIKLKKGDEVITTIFTCTATNIPMFYMGLKIKFADIERDTMNISIDSVKKLITIKIGDYNKQLITIQEISD